MSSLVVRSMSKEGGIRPINVIPCTLTDVTRSWGGPHHYADPYLLENGHSHVVRQHFVEFHTYPSQMGCMDVMSAVKVLHSMADVPVTRLGEVRASDLPCVPPLNPKKLQFPVSTTGKGDFSSSRRRAKTVSVTSDDIVVANIANKVREGYEQCDST